MISAEVIESIRPTERHFLCRFRQQSVGYRCATRFISTDMSYLWQLMNENPPEKVILEYTNYEFPSFPPVSAPFCHQTPKHDPFFHRQSRAPIIQPRHPLTRHTRNTIIRRWNRPNKIKAVARVRGLFSRNAKCLRDETELPMFPANQHVTGPRKGHSCCSDARGVVAIDGAVGCETEVGREGPYGFEWAEAGAICLGWVG